MFLMGESVKLRTKQAELIRDHSVFVRRRFLVDPGHDTQTEAR